jgi:hypothetical protein
MADRNDLSGSLPPADAFALVGDPTRVSILRALGDAARGADAGTDVALAFSDLYDRSVADSTQSLSYHLDELAGTFLERDDGQYRLTPTGARIVRAVFTGTYTEEPDVNPTTVDGACPRCGDRPLHATYEAGEIVVACDGCGTVLLSDGLPPAVAEDRDMPAILDYYDRHIRRKIGTGHDGACPECGGVNDRSIVRVGDESCAALSYHQQSECGRCGARVRWPVTFAILDHPVVVGFYWDDGCRIDAVPTWELYERLTTREFTLAVESDAPFDATLRIRRNDDELRLRLGDDACVRSATRVDRTEWIAEET